MQDIEEVEEVDLNAFDDSSHVEYDLTKKEAGIFCNN